jgi:hypothetical protein
MLTRFLSRSNFRVSRSAFEKERGERDLRRSQKSRAESPPGRIHFGGGIPLILQAKRPSTGVVSRRGDIEAASYLPLSLSLSLSSSFPSPVALPANEEIHAGTAVYF